MAAEHSLSSYRPADGAVISILGEQLLQESFEEPHFRGIQALPKKFSSCGGAGAAQKGAAAAPAGSKHEGSSKIKVNKEVLLMLKQVSAELDAAQRHYLAFKQFGEAGASLLKLSPHIISLPNEGGGGGLAAASSASQADLLAAAAAAAAAGGGGDTAPSGDAGGEQQGGTAAVAASARNSGSDEGAAAAAGAGAASKDLLVGHRRWGYLPMLRHLRATSDKKLKPPPPPPLENARRSADEVVSAAAASAGDADAGDMTPDSPRGNWAALMRQKKQEKELGLARMIRIKHAVLVIQRAWRACLQKRASRALAMMVLRAKVRRAHRAAYVSNLLRKKPRDTTKASTQNPDSTGTAAADQGLTDAAEPYGGDGDSDTDAAEPVVLDEQGEVVLTQQQEAEFELQLQQVLAVAAAGKKKAALPLELAHLAELLPDSEGGDSRGSSATLANSSSGSASEEEEEPEQAPLWKVISTPKAGPKRPLLRVDTSTPGGPHWQGTLRTPGPLTSSHHTPHRIGSPDSPHSGSGGHGRNSPAQGGSIFHSSNSPRPPQGRPRSTKQPRPVTAGTSSSSRPGSRAHGRLSTAVVAAAAAAGQADSVVQLSGGSQDADEGTAVAGGAEGSSKHSINPEPGAGARAAGAAGHIHFALDLQRGGGGGAGGGEGGSLSEGTADGWQQDSAAAAGEAGDSGGVVVDRDPEEGGNGGGSKTARGVRVRKKSVSVVVAAAKNAVAIANSSGEVVIRARSASRKLLQSVSKNKGGASRKGPAAGSAAADTAAAAVLSGSTAAADGLQSVAGATLREGQHHQVGGSSSNAATERGDAAAAAADGILSGSTATAVSAAQQQQQQQQARSPTPDSSQLPQPSRRSTREVVPQGAATGGSSSRACTPPPRPPTGGSNRGFYCASSGNAAFNRYERGLGDGLQQDFRVLPAEAVTASHSRAPTPPSGSSRRCSSPGFDGPSKPRTPQQPRRTTTNLDDVDAAHHVAASCAGAAGGGEQSCGLLDGGACTEQQQQWAAPSSMDTATQHLLLQQPQQQQQQQHQYPRNSAQDSSSSSAAVLSQLLQRWVCEQQQQQQSFLSSSAVAARSQPQAPLSEAELWQALQDLVQQQQQQQQQQQSVQQPGGTAPAALELQQVLMQQQQQTSDQQEDRQGAAVAAQVLQQLLHQAVVGQQQQQYAPSLAPTTAVDAAQLCALLQHHLLLLQQQQHRGQLRLTVSGLGRGAAAAGTAILASSSEQCCDAAAEFCSMRPEGPFLSISSFRERTILGGDTGGVDNNISVAAAAARGLEEYAAAVAAYRVSGLPDPSGLGGVVLAASGALQPQQQQQQQQHMSASAQSSQQQQQLSKAERWLLRARAKGAVGGGRQPWGDLAGAPSATDWGGGSSMLPNASAARGQAGSWLGGMPDPDMFAGDNSSSSYGVNVGVRGPVTGMWGRRNNVRDAWLVVDGRATAALPWQALAAVAAAGHAAESGGSSQHPTAAASGAACGPLSELSVTGRRLLVRLMWLKSAAGVVRGFGGNAAGFLEQKLVTLLKQETQPAGLELLLWSVADEQEQQHEAQAAIQQQQQQFCLPGRTGVAEAAQGENASGMWRQQSTPEHVLQAYALRQAGQLQMPQQQQQQYKASTCSGSAWFASSDAGRLAGEHLPLLPAARCAPLVGSRRATQQQQQQVWPPSAAAQQQLELTQGNLLVQTELYAEQQPLQQQRRWHYTVDDAGLSGGRQFHPNQHPQQQHQRFSTSDAPQPYAQAPAHQQQQSGAWLSSGSTAGMQQGAGVFMSQHEPLAATQAYGPQQQQQQQPMSVSRKALQARRITAVFRPLQETLQSPAAATQYMPHAWPGGGGGVAPGSADWLASQSVSLQSVGPAADTTAVVRQSQLLGSKGGCFSQALCGLSVCGEGGFAVPAHRQSSLPLLNQLPLRQQQRRQQQHQQCQSGMLAAQAVPLHNQLWAVPELHCPQPTVGLSFVSTKPQPHRRRTGQQLLEQQRLEQQAQPSMHQAWEQVQLQQQQQQQQHLHSLPQLPQLPVHQQHHQQRPQDTHGSSSSSSGLQLRQHSLTPVAAAAPPRPARLSLSDPGSTALLGAVSAAAGGLVGFSSMQSATSAGFCATTSSSTAARKPSDSGGISVSSGHRPGQLCGGSSSLSGSGGGHVHVAVVEQQLPQLAALRVAQL